MTGYEWLCDYLEGTGSHRQGRNWQCPAHRDSSPSLSVNPGENGAALIHCHAGCTADAVRAALGLDWRTARWGSSVPVLDALKGLARFPVYPQVVYKSRGGSKESGAPISTVHHVYLQDEIRLERVRFANGGKQIKWEFRAGRYWQYGLGRHRLETLPLYASGYLSQARALGEPVVLCESESSVDALIDSGVYATTWAGGAATPQLETLKAQLLDMRVLWIPDNDAAGLRCSEKVVGALNGVCDLRKWLPHVNEDPRDLLTRTTGERFRDSLLQAFDSDAIESETRNDQPRVWDQDGAAVRALQRVVSRGDAEVVEPAFKRDPSLSLDLAGEAVALDQRTATRSDVMRILVDLRYDDLGPRRHVLSFWLRDPALNSLIGYTEAHIRSAAAHLNAEPSSLLPSKLVGALNRHGLNGNQNPGSAVELRVSGFSPQSHPPT
jgi:hypothetical protein